MMASIALLSGLVSVAVAVTVVSPIILLLLLFLDWRKQRLW